MWSVYAASKVEAEGAAWKVVEEQGPGLVVNTVLPNTNVGKRLVNPPTSSGTLVPRLLKGDLGLVSLLPPRE